VEAEFAGLPQGEEKSTDRQEKADFRRSIIRKLAASWSEAARPKFGRAGQVARLEPQDAALAAELWHASADVLRADWFGIVNVEQLSKLRSRGPRIIFLTTGAEPEKHSAEDKAVREALDEMCRANPFEVYDGDKAWGSWGETMAYLHAAALGVFVVTKRECERTNPIFKSMVAAMCYRSIGAGPSLLLMDRDVCPRFPAADSPLSPTDHFQTRMYTWSVEMGLPWSAAPRQSATIYSDPSSPVVLLMTWLKNKLPMR